MRAIDYFDKQAEAVPDRIAIIDGGVRYSYADVRSASRQVARAMGSGGVSPAPCAVESAFELVGALLAEPAFEVTFEFVAAACFLGMRI